MLKRLLTHSAEETLELGHKIGERLGAGDCVLLFGGLGAGKTTFTQGLARGLGLPQEEYVRSPTFTLVNQYPGRIPIYHLDLYRLDTMDEMEELGLEEVFSGDGVCIVEWAEKLMAPTCEDEFSPLFGIDSHLQIRLKIEGDDSRSVEITTVHLNPETHPIFSLQ